MSIFILNSMTHKPYVITCQAFFYLKVKEQYDRHCPDVGGSAVFKNMFKVYLYLIYYCCFCCYLTIEQTMECCLDTTHATPQQLQEYARQLLIFINEYDWITHAYIVVSDKKGPKSKLVCYRATGDHRFRSSSMTMEYNTHAESKRSI